MPVLYNDERNIALGLLRSGMSCRAVARQMNCHHSTIARLVQHLNLTGTVAAHWQPGQPRVTTAAQDHHIVLTHLRNRFQNKVQTASNTRERKGLVNPATIRRRLWDAGLLCRRPYTGLVLNLLRCRRRMQWALHHKEHGLRDYCRSVLFSDESRINVSRSDGRTRVRRRRGERFDRCCVLEESVFTAGSLFTFLRDELMLKSTLNRNFTQLLFLVFKCKMNWGFFNKTMPAHTFFDNRTLK